MSSERNIIMKLKESKKLDEVGFDARGSHYSCSFGRYYKDGESISREEYLKAKGEGVGGSTHNRVKTFYVSFKAPEGKFKGKYVHKAYRAKSEEDAERMFKKEYPTVKKYDYKFAPTMSESDESAESEESLDEKTYTVGNTQYWRRSGKCYSWTATGGRKECSEEEYMRAISGSTSGGSVQHTEPHEDQAREINSPDPNLGKTVRLSGGRMGTIKTMNDLSVEEKREGTFGTVTINGVKYDVYDSLWANGFASLVRHEEESKPPVSKDDLDNAIGSSSTTKDRALLKVDGEEYYKIGDNKWEYHPSNSHAMPKTYTTDQMMDIVNKGKDVRLDKGSKPAPEPPKPVEPKKEERPSWDDTESDYISYKDVKRFDHTSWDIDGYETTITKRPGGGYRLENEDYDEEFETKGDLVRYLQDMEADYIGQDSENDY